MVEKHPNLELIGSSRNGRIAVEQLLSNEIDLLLLDIELKESTGFDLLEKLEGYFSGHIVFITAFDDYAIKAFEVGALDYLLKPFSVNRFNQCIDRLKNHKESTDIKRILELINVQKDNHLRIVEGNKIHLINENELKFIKGDGYYSEFNLENEKRLIRQSLKELESSLPDQFVRIHKSFIINLNKVIRLINHKSNLKLILEDATEFMVSSSYRQTIRNYFKL